VFSLRDRKKHLVDEINRDIDRLEQIEHTLEQESFIIPTRPQMKPEEIPEKYLNI
jgi:hypothetical protein